MHYITVRYALNLPCGLKTPGDWHFYALDWSKVIWADSADSVWGDYGIELHNDVPGQTGKVGVANHIRALLDLIAAGAFSVAWGMRENYLNNDALAPEVFAKVWLLHSSPRWAEINLFMLNEYDRLWLDWKIDHGENPMTDTPITWTDDERTEHRAVIGDLLKDIYRDPNAGFILKGGTALMMCWGLDRFSEDIDLDSEKQNIIPIVKRFCERKGYPCFVTKDTPVVKRCMIHYQGEKHPLKVEVSYRDKCIDPDDCTEIPVNRTFIRVYTIDALANKKCRAFLQREAVRDLYDLCFICRKYVDQLEPSTVKALREAFQYRGEAHVDAMVKANHDPLIDGDKLVSDYLDAVEALDQRQAAIRAQREAARGLSR